MPWGADDAKVLTGKNRKEILQELLWQLFATEQEFVTDTGFGRHMRTLVRAARQELNGSDGKCQHPE